MASSAKKLPFFIEITPVEERWLKEDGRLEKLGMPLVTLPAGTVLFRSLRLPMQGQYNFSLHHFYRDYLGDNLDPETTCVSPKHNIFFSSVPFIGFGLHNIGKNMNAYMAFVLVHPTTVIAAISPSIMVRGAPHVFSGMAPIQRCSTLPYDCKKPDAVLEKALAYDNCIHPLYSLRTGVRGWMALADLDSAYPHSLRKKKRPATDSELYMYMKKLKARHPDIANELLTNLYTDGHHHAGFPEIAIYPYKKHHGEMLTLYQVRNEADAQRLLYKEALADNLNYLPLVLFTANKTVDLTQGLFTRERFDPLPFMDASQRELQIENQIIPWLTEAKTTGITLPHYGKGKLMFDTRTGFYVLEQFVPERFMIRLPKHAVESDVKRMTDKKVRLFEPYKKFLLPMSTEEERKRVLAYTLLFRSWVPTKFMHGYGIEKGWGARRAFVFERPPVLASVYKAWNWDIPKEYTGTLARAAALYQKETGKMPKAKPVKASKDEDGTGVDAAKIQETLELENLYGMPVSAWDARMRQTQQATTASVAAFQAQQGQQVYPPPSPTYNPTSPTYAPFSTYSPSYQPTSPVYGAEEQKQGSTTPSFFASTGQSPYVAPQAQAQPQAQEAPYSTSSPPYVPTSPPYSSSSPPYQPTSPVYGAEQQPKLFAPKSPEFGRTNAEEAAAVGITLEQLMKIKEKRNLDFLDGGASKAKHPKKQTRARKLKAHRQTRRRPKSLVFDIWKIHALSKKNQRDDE